MNSYLMISSLTRVFDGSTSRQGWIMKNIIFQFFNQGNLYNVDENTHIFLIRMQKVNLHAS